MKHPYRILIFIITLFLLSCFFLRNIVKPVYFEEIFKSKDLEFAVGDAAAGFTIGDKDTIHLETVAYDNSLDTYEALYEAADIVVIGTPTDRVQDENVVNTKFVIKNIVKGNVGNIKEISVFEPFYITKGNKKIMELRGGYFPMSSQHEYYLFLKREPIYDNEQYNLVSYYYGKIPLDENFKQCKIKDGTFYNYQKYQECDDLIVDVSEERKDIEEAYKEEPNTFDKETLNAIKRYEGRADKFLELMSKVKSTIGK